MHGLCPFADLEQGSITRMTSKQWLLITLVVILNIIIFGALIGPPRLERTSTPTPTWTPVATFTALPRPTATAILMPTLEATTSAGQ
jgi:uncharacterized membrane protein